MYSTAPKIPFCTDLLDIIGSKVFYRYHRKIIECREVFQRHNKMAILDLFQTISRRPMKSEQWNNCQGNNYGHPSYDILVHIMVFHNWLYFSVSSNWPVSSFNLSMASW